MTPIELVLSKLAGFKKSGDGWSARCPAHDDRTASLSIGVGEDGRVLLHCFAGCAVNDICSALEIQSSELFANSANNQLSPKRTIAAVCAYRDENKSLLFEIVRFKPKSFKQHRPDGKGGYSWNTRGVRRVLYRLPELIAALAGSWIFIVEGEKDADRLASVGIIATTNSGGAGKWSTVDGNVLHERRICLLPDNDPAGIIHMHDVARQLEGKAREIRIVELPNLASKGDVSDWLDAGHTVDELVQLLEQAPVYTSESAEPLISCWQPFPLEVLPTEFRAFVESNSNSMECDPTFTALPLLAVMASAVGTTRRIKLKARWCEFCILWTVIVGKSGSSKSPAFEQALRLLHTRQNRAMRLYREEMKRFAAAWNCYESEEAEWKNKGRKTGATHPAPPETPICEQAYVEDSTMEAMAAILVDHPRGLLLARDELSGWFGFFNQYKRNSRADEADWLNVFSGRPLKKNRKTGNPLSTTIYVPMAAVSIAGGIQPDLLRRALRPEYFENGIAARSLLPMPPPTPKRWTDHEVSPEIEQAIERIHTKLHAFQHDTSEDGEPIPRDLPLSVDAKQLWASFVNEVGLEQVGADDRLSACWAKLEAYASRLALLVHFMRWAGEDRLLSNSEVVDAQSIAAGITLARWFGNEARRVYAMLCEGEREPEQRALLEMINQRGGRMSVRELMQAKARFRSSAEKADAALKDLVSTGFGEWVEVPPSSRGGQPTRMFQSFIGQLGNTTAKKSVRHEVPLLLPPMEN
ncbi:MAG: DUF3987 domain-containing protein [Planctomycetes bacterium]|nr:DUF3987 domain-containing protein [Planctomycetota bacterium]